MMKPELLINARLEESKAAFSHPFLDIVAEAAGSLNCGDEAKTSLNDGLNTPSDADDQRLHVPMILLGELSRKQWGGGLGRTRICDLYRVKQAI